ncbi:MAG: hypothetical protein ACFE0I_24870 [Elainellaceae cyanobacterium]
MMCAGCMEGHINFGFWIWDFRWGGVGVTCCTGAIGDRPYGIGGLFQGMG